VTSVVSKSRQGAPLPARTAVEAVTVPEWPVASFFQATGASMPRATATSIARRTASPSPSGAAPAAGCVGAIDPVTSLGAAAVSEGELDIKDDNGITMPQPDRAEARSKPARARPICGTRVWRGS
jgi:hypothetical protein